MTTENSTLGAPARETRWGPGLYLFLVGVQSAGAGIGLLKGVPIYRELFHDIVHHERQPGILWWAWAVVVLIQGGYWLRVRLQPPLPTHENILLGHLIIFVGRLSFVVATSTFSLLFLNHYDEAGIPLHRMLMVFVLMFSMFCWTLELERLGKASFKG